MLSELSFSDKDVAKICKNPFKNLETLVKDVKVEVNKGKAKKSMKSVKVRYWWNILLWLENDYFTPLQLTVPEGTYFQKNWNIEEAKRSAAIGLLWILLKEEKVKKVDLNLAPPTAVSVSTAKAQKRKRDRAARRKANARATEAAPLPQTDPKC